MGSRPDGRVVACVSRSPTQRHCRTRGGMSMRISTVIFNTVGVLMALSAMPALAGQPADPGAGGQINQDVKAAADFDGVTPGQEKKDIVDFIGPFVGDDNWGQVKQDLTPDGRPTH